MSVLYAEYNRKSSNKLFLLLDNYNSKKLSEGKDFVAYDISYPIREAKREDEAAGFKEMNGPAMGFAIKQASDAMVQYQKVSNAWLKAYNNRTSPAFRAYFDHITYNAKHYTDIIDTTLKTSVEEQIQKMKIDFRPVIDFQGGTWKQLKAEHTRTIQTWDWRF